ncbi:MAG TPA: UDP-N-acetylmuramate--L-alanine ligase [Streptosporangiaceae bacterium]|nr:UDP-N-acetylmuramate--L-alanine ligase [Streptosporangiaceae bacterium]
MGLVTPSEAVPLSELGRVHFTGIGGAGMSGIARIMLAGGVTVSGTDSAASAQLDELAALGAQVAVGHAAGHLGDADTLVVSTAIRPDNPELAEARRRGLRVLHRSAALASVMLGRQGIAVAGTHGKTTTTSMITTVLRDAGADPSYVIGGILAGTGRGADAGSGPAFVAEADESDGSFLNLSPDAAVVTCVEADHLDNYADLAQIEAAFRAFAGRISPGGLMVTCADDGGARKLADTARADAGAAGRRLRLVSYGTAADASYRVSGVAPSGMTVSLVITGGPGTRAAGAGPVPVRLAVPGAHNALNAAAAFALCAELGIEPARIAAGLAGYAGARRRLEPKGEADGVLVLDSYAHHPTELAADLAAARDIASGGRVIALFQPHLFSRTRIFAGQFGAALGRADEVIVLDIYAAREDPEPGVTGRLVADAVPGGQAQFLPARAAAPAVAAGLAKPGDVVLTMGAGDVTALGPLIVAALRERAGEPGADVPAPGRTGRA